MEKNDLCDDDIGEKKTVEMVYHHQIVYNNCKFWKNNHNTKPGGFKICTYGFQGYDYKKEGPSFSEIQDRYASESPREMSSKDINIQIEYLRRIIDRKRGELKSEIQSADAMGMMNVRRIINWDPVGNRGLFFSK